LLESTSNLINEPTGSRDRALIYRGRHYDFSFIILLHQLTFHFQIAEFGYAEVPQKSSNKKRAG